RSGATHISVLAGLVDNSAAACSFVAPQGSMLVRFAGYYCPAGTQFGTEFPCSVSTYNNMTGSISSAACLPCSQGHYCASPGLALPTGPCAGGLANGYLLC